MYQSLQLFLVFFKIGAFTLGSGLAMLPQVRNELVTKKKWLTEDEFIDILAITQSAPGPIAVNLAVYLGLKINGFKGMIATAFGSTLPSFIIILLIAILFQDIQHNEYFIAAFKAIKPASVALILLPVITISKRTGVTGFKFLIPIAIAAIITWTPISPILIIVFSIIFGIVFYGRKKS